MDELRSIPVDPSIYAAFIRQIELRQIWLRSATVENGHGANTPALVNAAVEERAEWKPLSSGFQAFHHYRVGFEADSGVQSAVIEVTFGVEFVSKEEMTEEFFAIFADVNLPVNTWPFLRAFLFTTVGRMGWAPITLPAFKVGTGDEEPRADAKAKPRAKRQKAVAKS